MFVTFAVGLFAFIVVVVVYFSLTHAEADRRDAVTGCRSRVAANLSAAQVDNDLAFDDLVIGLADRSTVDLDVQLRQIRETKEALRVARDARVAFEEHPTGKC